MDIDNTKTILFCELNTIFDFDALAWERGVFKTLSKFCSLKDYSLILYGTRSGVGTEDFPREQFEEEKGYLLSELQNQGIFFDECVFNFEDTPFDGKVFSPYFEGANKPRYNISTLGNDILNAENIPFSSWYEVCELFFAEELKHRKVELERNTKETQIRLHLNLDGNGNGHIHTGIGFFDHMLDQLVKHSRCDIDAEVKGDLYVDEHHSVEDLAITLGQAYLKALGDKRGINRYGFDILMMDDVIATVSLDFSGRPGFIYEVNLARESVGGFPTEMFKHFFKSFSDEAKCNLYIKCTDGNTHHQIEAIFKAFARSLKDAALRIPGNNELPSTKGVL